MDLSAVMDDDSAAVAIQLMLQDSQDLSASIEAKGKPKEGEMSDSQLALALYQEELERNASIIRDRGLARSITRACQTDHDVVPSTVSEEQIAARDHAVDCRLGGVPQPALIGPAAAPAQEDLDDETMNELTAKYIELHPEFPRLEYPATASGLDIDDTNGEPSTFPTAREPETEPEPFDFRTCAACQEQIVEYNLAPVPCGHEYCVPCLEQLFRSSLTDESLFPPRCCRQAIAPATLPGWLTLDLILEYEKKKVEFETPDRTYCSNASCTAFIPPKGVAGERAVCEECEAVTCIICKAAEHGGDCSKDGELEKLLEAARENGWQRCYSCRRVVELTFGCNHITCACGSEFCYLCGVQWKQCPCEQWEEGRLLQRVQQIIARQNAQARAPPPPVEYRMVMAAQQLRERNECARHIWEKVLGTNTCDLCRQRLPKFIFRCRECLTQACHRCRLNRL